MINKFLKKRHYDTLACQFNGENRKELSDFVDRYGGRDTSFDTDHHFSFWAKNRAMELSTERDCLFSCRVGEYVVYSTDTRQFIVLAAETLFKHYLLADV